MPYPYVDQLIQRAIDPNDNTVTLTVRGEILLMPGIYMCVDDRDHEDGMDAADKLKPYQGVEFITFPKKDAEALINAISAAAKKHYDKSDTLEDHRQLLGDDGALAFERLIDRAGFLTTPTTFYMENNDTMHEGTKRNVIG